MLGFSKKYTFLQYFVSVMQSLILFASGTGSNVRAIIDYFKSNEQVAVSLIVCNKAGAGVLNIAREEQIPFLVVDKAQFSGDAFLKELQNYEPSLIVLAGFLWKMPDAVVQAFPDRIINIHPALLPAYGGKGMYGSRVHASVLAAGERESGITIHYVNEVYDDGRIILQARCPITDGDNIDSLAGRIHRLEHFFYSRTIAFLLQHLSE